MSDSKRQRLQSLQDEMDKDDSLPLKKGATRLVFGDGDPETEILFIGEGPGYWEDQKGIPFVGNAGSFLNQLLGAIEMDRKKVFITNVVHHRPPNNRDPEIAELEAYGKYLDKIIAIIRPRIIVTLGRFSMAKFLPGVTITQMHGKPKEVVFGEMKILIVPMYHPAAGLRNGEIRRRTVEDFKGLPAILEQFKKDMEKLDAAKEKDFKQLGLI